MTIEWLNVLALGLFAPVLGHSFRQKDVVLPGKELRCLQTYVVYLLLAVERFDSGVVVPGLFL